MKKFKKTISIIMCLVVALSLSVNVMADEITETPTTDSTVTDTAATDSTAVFFTIRAKESPLMIYA